MSDLVDVFPYAFGEPDINNYTRLVKKIGDFRENRPHVGNIDPTIIFPDLPPISFVKMKELNPAILAMHFMQEQGQSFDIDEVQNFIQERKNMLNEPRIEGLLSGIELEVDQPKEIECSPLPESPYMQMVNKINSLSNIGIDIGPEALREISLPPSKDYRDNILAVDLLDENGLLPQADHGVHLNFSGISNPENYIEDIIVLINSLNLSSTFGNIGPMKEIVWSDTPYGEFINKNINERDDMMCVLGFRILKDRIELQTAVDKWQSTAKFKEDFQKFYRLIEGLTAYSRYNQGAAEYGKIANEWTTYKNEFYKIIGENLTTRIKKISKLTKLFVYKETFSEEDMNSLEGMFDYIGNEKIDATISELQVNARRLSAHSRHEFKQSILESRMRRLVRDQYLSEVVYSISARMRTMNQFSKQKRLAMDSLIEMVQNGQINQVNNEKVA